MTLLFNSTYFSITIYKWQLPHYSEGLNKLVIARSEATWQSYEIASLRSQWHNANVNFFLMFTIIGHRVRRNKCQHEKMLQVFNFSIIILLEVIYLIILYFLIKSNQIKNKATFLPILLFLLNKNYNLLKLQENILSSQDFLIESILVILTIFGCLKLFVSRLTQQLLISNFIGESG